LQSPFWRRRLCRHLCLHSFPTRRSSDLEALVRTGLRMILAPAADLEVVGEAASGPEALLAINRDRPDVVLMDVRMPGGDGLTALDRKSTRLNSSHVKTSYAVFCLKKKT